MGAQIVGEKLALELVKSFLDARFTADEYFRRRDAKLTEMERRLKAE